METCLSNMARLQAYIYRSKCYQLWPRHKWPLGSWSIPTFLTILAIWAAAGKAEMGFWCQLSRVSWAKISKHPKFFSSLLRSNKTAKRRLFCSTALTSTGWVRLTIKLLLHCPLPKQCTLSINLCNIKNFLRNYLWKNLGNAKNRTRGRGASSKYAIHCAKRKLCGVVLRNNFAQ